MNDFRTKARILDVESIRKTLTRIAHEILEKHPAPDGIALVGIRSRGEFLAQRLAGFLKEMGRPEIPVGALDITLYRDDIPNMEATPVVRATEIPFDVTSRKIIIVDDVLYTGRTVRAAMDALADLGRPASIELAILVDRGHRQLPIRPDYVGKNVPTSQNQQVQVRLKELDGIDEVLLEEDAA
ncbi:MAG: bifunctional pyr operon transcriptional regulator/uracil phosphoribosyltransferase PyrR [Candidatus Omnitrophica bacterium]|nr:bifunctional pyr operon transcriptional regulator/uracil phosphoribosyltransferase PyrR [Candidatus Omnitrophota bacterium]